MDRTIDMVKVKSIEFNSIQLVTVTKLETSRGQKALHWNTK